MAVVQATYVTISCNGPNCPNTVTFSQADEEKVFSSTPWLKTLRMVQQIRDKRNFSYCSDSCELAAVAAGQHNPIEKKVIIDTLGNANLIAQAAAEAKAQEEAARALRAGRPITIQGS